MENITRKTITLNLNAKKYLPELLWVLKARSKDKNREPLKYLNIDDSGYACTDGRRLHFSSNRAGLPAGLENGLYDVIVAKDLIIFNPQEGIFPEYKTIIPKNIETPLELYINDDSQSISCALTSISCRVLQGLNSINYDYLKDLAGEKWIIHGSPGMAIKFIAPGRLAVVMPLRLAEIK